jgi:hypothetical protein
VKEPRLVLCISGVLCPGQAWRTESLVLSIPSASASASAPASSISLGLGPYPGFPLQMLFVLSRFCPAEPAFSSSLSLSLLRGLSPDRACSYGVSRGGVYGRRGVFGRGLYARRRRFFFKRADIGAFLLFLPFSFACRFSLSLSLSHRHSPGPAPPRAAMSQREGRGGMCETNDVYERNVVMEWGLNSLIPRL